MKAVCNASPLITLAKAGLLDVLHHLFDRVVVPDAVVREVRVAGPEDPGALALERMPWLERVVLNPPVSRLGTMSLGAGESEVIEWALRHPGHVAILDDRAARRSAQALGLPCAGTLRLLYEADCRRLAPPFSEAVRRLRDAGFYLDQRLIDGVIAASGRPATQAEG